MLNVSAGRGGEVRKAALLRELGTRRLRCYDGGEQLGQGGGLGVVVDNICNVVHGGWL